MAIPYLNETIVRFCTRDNAYARWQQNKAAYYWIEKHWIDDGSVFINAFRAVLLFMIKNKKAPNSIKAVIDWVMVNPADVSRFQKSEIVEGELRDLKDHEPLDLDDDDVLFEALLKEARQNWAVNQYKRAISLAIGGGFNKGKDGEQHKGVTESIQWLRGELTNDFSPEAAVLDGKLNENIPAILQNIESRLTAKTNGKFPLGMEHIDRNVIVGRQNLRFLGILGMSGDGKTTLTNFITYNWLKQGAHILYVSTEHSPEEIWNFMAWLHQSHSDYDFVLPPMQDWEGGRDSGKVTKQDEHNLTKILNDIQDRKNLPGLLDCKQFRDWDAIKDYLETNQKKNKYDVLVVDYINRLNVPGDQKFRDKAIAAIVHDAQRLTREFDDNRGLILLTPLQVNREANKRANAADEEATTRYDLNAISTISEYQHDLDLCLSVWSDADMKMGDEIEIEQVKQRKGRKSMKQRMILNRNSGAFETTLNKLQAQKGKWDTTVDDVLASTTTVDIGI